MRNADVLYRRTASGVVLLLSLMIGSVAVNPYSETAVIGRIAMLVVVALLIVGILPGSYLQRRIRAASEKESVLRSRLLRVTGLMTPMVVAALSALMLLIGYDDLRFIDSTNIGTIDRGEVKFRLVHHWTIGLACLVWLVLAVSTLLRKRTQGEQTQA